MRQLIYLIFLLTAGSSFGQNKETRIEHFNINNQNVYNDGFDPVSYFNGAALQGKEQISYEYLGIIYWFASEANHAKFKKAPEKYDPQYGGWCAFALGHKAEKVKIDPETYKIANGKLYLFYNFYMTNTLKSWNKDEAHLMLNANKNWQTIIKQ